MTWTRLVHHRTAHRIAAVDDLPFPSSTRHRLQNQHPHLSGDDFRVVEAATRQWFRLVARHPKATLSMPSVVVDALWREWARHERDYAAFCDAAFGHALPHRPEPAMAADTANTTRIPGLLATLDHARQDEGCGATDLPLLFRVDQSLRIRDGNRYLADCGGRGECFQAPGLICLQHLAGPGRGPTTRGIRDPSIYDGLQGYAGGAFGVSDIGGGDGI
jgi:hypothetical protein